MRQRAEEHFKNHPNDIPQSDRYKKIMNKYHRLDHLFSVSDIKHRVKIMLQKEQIRSDTRIKDMMIEMYPEEYDKALQEVFKQNGMMKKQKERREEILKAWGVKKEKMPKWTK